MSDATILYGPWETKVVPLAPRAHFGQRKTPVLGDLPGALNRTLDVALGRPEDRAQQENFNRIAREIRAAAGPTCPTLKAELSAEIGVIAQLCELAANKCCKQGELRAAVSLREMQSIAETISAEVSPFPPEQPA